MSATEYIKQFPEKTYIPKVNIVSATRNAANNLILKLEILEGIVALGDVIRLRLSDGTIKAVKIKNVFVNGQQTTLGVAGEYAEVVVSALPNLKIQRMYKESTEYSKSRVDILTEIDLDLAAIGVTFSLYESGKISKDRFEFLIECPLLREKVIYLSEDLLDKVRQVGLRALRNNWKKLAIGTALGMFIYDKWSKLNKECLLKLGKEKLLCQRRVAERIINEIRKQAAECNTLLDPKEKKKCLKEVEKKRAYWVKKLADLNEKIGKYKP